MKRRYHIQTRALIFDMDGVITNTMPDHYRAWKKIFAQEGIAVNYYDIYRREGQRGISSVREIFAEKGRPYTPARGRLLLREKERLFKKIVARRFIPGARRFVREMRRRGFILAVVTGTSRHEARKILTPALGKLFSVIVTGSDVKNGKPHPEPYLLALKKLALLAADAVVIENAPFGIESARRARLLCIALTTSLPRRYLRGANHIFSSLREMHERVLFAQKDAGADKRCLHR